MEGIPKVLLIAAILAMPVSAQDYCSGDICDPGDRHIDCNNSGKFASRCPATARIINIKHHPQKSLILQMVNVRRNRVATGDLSGFKKAIRMPTVQWSNDLARLAALSAKRCSTEFDQCRNTITFKRVAQLVFNQYSTGCININYREHIIKMIQTWFTQYQNANAGRMENFTRANPVYSAFAILVNQRVTHIGCGTVTFKQNRRLDVITICNFASRNMPGTAVYQAGDTASNCTTGTNPTYPGLCSIDEAVDPNAD